MYFIYVIYVQMYKFWYDYFNSIQFHSICYKVCRLNKSISLKIIGEDFIPKKTRPVTSGKGIKVAQGRYKRKKWLKATVFKWWNLGPFITDHADS